MELEIKDTPPNNTPNNANNNNFLTENYFKSNQNTLKNRYKLNFNTKLLDKSQEEESFTSYISMLLFLCSLLLFNYIYLIWYTNKYPTESKYVSLFSF